MLQTKAWAKIWFLLLKPILKPDSACFLHTRIYICRTHPCCWKDASISANKNQSFWFCSAFILLLEVTQSEKQQLFTHWSEIIQRWITALIHRWGGSSQEVTSTLIQARFWLSKAQTHRGRNILSFCSNLTISSGENSRTTNEVHSASGIQ